jgi:hypothetical protein
MIDEAGAAGEFERADGAKDDGEPDPAHAGHRGDAAIPLTSS